MPACVWVVLGYIETASYTEFMADAIADCRHRWPGIELVLVQDRTLNLVEALAGHAVDIARPVSHTVYRDNQAMLHTREAKTLFNAPAGGADQ